IGMLWVMFQRIGQALNGWNFHQVLMIYGMGELTFSLFSMVTLGLTFALPGHYILEGHLDRPLLRPLNLLFQCCIEQLSLNDWTIALKGVAILWWCLSQPDTVAPGTLRTPLWWIASVAVIVGGAFIYNGMFFTLSCVSFWLKDRVSLTWPLFD